MLNISSTKRDKMFIVHWVFLKPKAKLELLHNKFALGIGLKPCHQMFLDQSREAYLLNKIRSLNVSVDVTKIVIIILNSLAL
jgi:hypothetical protein